MALADRHPDAERLAEYADGLLAANDRTQMERHLTTCADCRAAVVDTMAFLAAEAGELNSEPEPRVWPFRGRRWLTVAATLAAAAAIVLAVRLSGPEWLAAVLPFSDRPQLQELIAAVGKEPRRPVEGRLTGGFKYAPAPETTRGAADHAASTDVRIAALKLEQAATNGKGAGALEAAGVGALVLGDVDTAIERLGRAVERQPSASAFSDLAAAYLARASYRGGGGDLDSALVAADRALALEPTLREALFNRALALSRLGRIDQANAAWRHYSELETDRDWAAEASRLSLRSFLEPRP